MARQRLASPERLLVCRQQEHPFRGVVENAVARATLVADQRIEDVHELKLRWERAPAARLQRFLLDIGLSHPALRARLQDPGLAVHIALRGCRHEAESQCTIQPIGREVFSNRILGALSEHGRHALAFLFHDHVQCSGAARSSDCDVTGRQERSDGCIVERV